MSFKLVETDLNHTRYYGIVRVERFFKWFKNNDNKSYNNSFLKSI